MSAVPIATSVPDPRASPRSAAASAGPSLTPSPTIATRCPRARRPAMTSAFPAGRVPAMTSSMPTTAATARAVASLSPVSRTGCTPRPRRSAMAARAVGLIASAPALAPRRPRPSRPARRVKPARSHRPHRAESSSGTGIPWRGTGRHGAVTQPPLAGRFDSAVRPGQRRPHPPAGWRGYLLARRHHHCGPRRRDRQPGRRPCRR
jgi:hypothetical protein